MTTSSEETWGTAPSSLVTQMRGMGFSRLPKAGPIRRAEDALEERGVDDSLARSMLFCFFIRGPSDASS